MAAASPLTGERGLSSWVAGADAVETAEQKAKGLLAQVEAYRDLSSSLAHDDAA